MIIISFIITEAISQAKDELFIQESCGGFAPSRGTMFVSQNLFALAGQLFSSSICQGGPAPSFLATWVYNYLVHGSDATLPIDAHSLDGRNSPYEEVFKKVLFVGFSRGCIGQ